MTVFDRIYRSNAWNGVESRSGPGSGTAATEQVAREIVALVTELGVTSVIDAACGDGFWMPDLPGYLGIDVSPQAIKLARRNHPDRLYLVADVGDGNASIDPRAVGLVILRDAIQHLPLSDGVNALDRIRSFGARWFLASTYVGGENVDIAAGDCYWPDLEAEPFSMGKPDRLIFDGWGYGEPGEVRDPRKFLALWKLA